MSDDIDLATYPLLDEPTRYPVGRGANWIEIVEVN